MSYDPYQPPRTFEPAVGPAGLRVSGVGLAASICLALGVGLQGVEIGAWALLDAVGYESVQRATSAIGGLARLAGVITFLVWTHRIVSKVRAYGVQGLKYTPGNAVGLWFVPFLNLIHGYQVVTEAWKASDPATAGDSSHVWLSGDRQSGIVLHWWLAYTASRIAIIATRVAWSPAVWVIGVGVELVALTLMIVVICRLDLRQNEYERRLVALRG